MLDQYKCPSIIPNQRSVCEQTGHRLASRLTLPRQCLDRLVFFLLALWQGPLEVFPRHFQIKYKPYKVFDLPHEFHSKQIRITRTYMLGMIKKHIDRLNGYLSKVFDVLGRLTCKLHKTLYNSYKYYYKTFYDIIRHDIKYI